MGLLFTFLARQLGTGAGEGVAPHLCARAVGALTGAAVGEGREEREQALLDMVAAGGWERFDLGELEAAAEGAGFARVLEGLYRQQGRVDRVLGCFLGGSRAAQAFPFLKGILADPGVEEGVREVVAGQVKAAVAELAAADARQTAALLCAHLRPRVREVVGGLEVAARLEVLGAVVEWREGGSSPSTPVHGGAEEDYLSSTDLYRDYVDVMLQVEPTKASAYLRARPDLCPAEQLLELAERHQVQEVQVLLLERQGRVLEAFAILRRGLEEQVEELERVEEEEPSSSLQWTSINTALLLAVNFCQRVSPALASVEEREAVWCPLLATVAAPLARGAAGRWRELVRHVLSAMLGHVAHDKVVAAALAHSPTSTAASWAELRRLLAEILETLRYESRLLEAGRRVVEEERAGLVRRLVRGRWRGLRCSATTCSSCGAALGAGGGRAVVFPCHALHAACVDRAGGLELNTKGEEVGGGGFGKHMRNVFRCGGAQSANRLAG